MAKYIRALLVIVALSFADALGLFSPALLSSPGTWIALLLYSVICLTLIFGPVLALGMVTKDVFSWLKARRSTAKLSNHD